MEAYRKVIWEAQECCLPYTDLYGQPVVHVVKTFLPAATYAEYAKQEVELHALLELSGACKHIREIAIHTHKTLCGNDTHLETAKQASCFNMDPEDFEALMNNS